MAKTRGTDRKRKIHDIYEHDLGESEKAGKGEGLAVNEAIKQQQIDDERRRRHESYGDYFAAVPAEILSKIFFFVDSPAVLFQFANWTKTCRKVISSEMVIRSAVFSDESKHNESISSVITLIKGRSIHTPSSLRLLRLVNGKHCEMLDKCFQMNIKSNQSGCLPQHGERPFGLALCSRCVNAMGHRIVLNYDHSHCNHRLVLANGKLALPNQHQEHGTREVAGPIVLAYQIKQIQCTYRRSYDNQRAAMNKLFSQHSQSLSVEEKANRDCLVECFTAAKSEKKKRDAEASRIQRIRMAKQCRITGENALATMTKLLGDYEYKDLLLAGSFGQNGCFYFKNGGSQDLLARVVRNWADVETVASRLARAKSRLDLMIFISGFGTGNWDDFPGSLANSSLEVTYEEALMRLKTANENWGTRLEDPRSIEHFHMDTLFDLEHDTKVEALLWFLKPEDLRDVFMNRVISTDTPESTASNFRRLAQVVWKDPDYYRSKCIFVEIWRTTYQETVALFEHLCHAMNRYLKKHRVRKFLKLDDENATQGAYTRHRALENIFRLKGNAKDLLLSNNLNGLFELHKLIYENPSRYSRR